MAFKQSRTMSEVEKERKAVQGGATRSRFRDGVGTPGGLRGCRMRRTLVSQHECTGQRIPRSEDE